MQIDHVTLLCWTKILAERNAISPDDAATAASAVWDYLRSHPRVGINEATATQLLQALSARPDLVVDVITALHRGALAIRANPQHFAIALTSLAASKDVLRAKEVYRLISSQPDFSMDRYVVNAMLAVYGSDVGQYWEEAKELFETAKKLGKVIPTCCHQIISVGTARMFEFYHPAGRHFCVCNYAKAVRK